METDRTTAAILITLDIMAALIGAALIFGGLILC